VKKYTLSRKYSPDKEESISMIITVNIKQKRNRERKSHFLFAQTPFCM
jgi:hypothetical protein